MFTKRNQERVDFYPMLFLASAKSADQSSIDELSKQVALLRNEINKLKKNP